MVAGAPLQRPAWFYDVTKQGEGIVDVTTHLVDLVQWGVFPDKVLGIDDAKVLSAKTWTTKVSREQFERSTKVAEFPDYLQKWQTPSGEIEIPCNGEFTFVLNGVHAKISVIWNYEAPAGGGDTHYSLLRGAKASAVIRQGKEQNFKPVLYLEPRDGVDPATLEEPLAKATTAANDIWPGVVVTRNDNGKGWIVNAPQKYHLGHEAHFTKVAGNFISYLKAGKMPDWEVPNMLAKYRTIMDAYQMSRK
jgi:predicted dehydrogenase